MSNYPSPSSDVAAVVWPWRNPPRPCHRPGPLRVVAQAAIPLSIAAWFYFRRPFAHAVQASYVIAGIGTLLLWLGLFAPKAFTRVERAVFTLVGWIGVALSWITLVPLFYTFFVGARVILTLRGKDPLHRRLDPGAASYWIIRKPIQDPGAHYRRQF